MLRVILFFPATKVFGFIYIQFTVFASFTFIFIITHHHHHNNKNNSIKKYSPYKVFLDSGVPGTGIIPVPYVRIIFTRHLVRYQ
jgi:hypothetical protein